MTTTVATYNLIKEGDIYNVPSVATFYPSVSGLCGLSLGSPDAASFTLPSGTVSSLEVEFGEFFGVSELKYYVNPLVLDDISITYGINNGTEYTCSITSSGTYAHSVINDAVGYLRVTHSGSVNVEVKYLFLEGQENQDLTFGSTLSGTGEALFFDNSPIAYLSSDSLEVPVYNNKHYPVDVKVAVAPTGSNDDNYLYIGLESDGTFYGINDYGKKQPAFESISCSDYSFDLDSVSDLSSDWDVTLNSRSYAYTDTECLSFIVNSDTSTLFRETQGYNDAYTIALTNKDVFTGNQSFSISLDVKIWDLDFKTNYYTPNKLMLGVTNSWPIPEALLPTTDYETPSSSRFGRSLAAVWVGGQLDSQDLYVGGLVQENEYSSYTNFDLVRSGSNGYPIVSYIGLEDLSSNTFRESTYYDGTEDAEWRTLKLSYDHQLRKVFFFINNVFLSSYKFSSESIYEGCRFFISFLGIGAASFSIRNFSIDKDVVLSVWSDQSNAAAFSSKDADQGPSKLIDTFYGTDNFSGAWVSDSNPSSGDSFEILFNSPQDVHAMRVRKPSSTDVITISGVADSSYKTRYSLNDLTLTFDTGDIRFVAFSDPTPTGMDGWDVCNLVTSSGTVEPVSAASSVTASITTLTDRGSNLPLMCIEEMQFYTLSGVSVTHSNVESDNEIPWRNGIIKNLGRRGSSDVYEVEDTALRALSTTELCENLVRYSDYDVSSPVFSSDSSAHATSYHYAESIFKRVQTNEHTEISLYPGPSGWVWRYLDQKIDLGAVYFTVYSNPTTGNFYTGKPNKWKLQYLKEGGNPNTESNWADIPVLSVSYSTPSDYADYVDYLITNNDGEYYTNYINIFDIIGTVLLPSDLICYGDSVSSVTQLNPFTSPTAGFYIELDQTIRTQAVRVYIDTGYNDLVKSQLASGYTFGDFVVYARKPIGSYLSPVFDTGTSQNTERIYPDAVNYGGDLTVLFRSSSTPPTYNYDQFYEAWEDLGEPFSGISDDMSDYFDTTVSMVSYSDTIYFLGDGGDEVLTYKPSTGLWSVGFDYPTESDGNKSKPDSRTLNNSVIVGNNLIVASRVIEGGVSDSSLIKYSFVETSYEYSGWDTYPYQRQAEAIQASVVSDGSSKVFFLSVDGTVTVFYLSTGELTTAGITAVPLHGATYREDYVASYHSGKLYVIGGNLISGTTVACNYVDIYDIENNTWTSGYLAPYALGYAWSINYGNYIYVLPYSSAPGVFAPYMKYDIQNDSWNVIPSLGYNRANYWLNTNLDVVGDRMTSDSYCLLDNYIYGFNYTYYNVRRFKVGLDYWEENNLPSKEDTSWYSVGGIPWTEVTVSGETMPQDRYIQYRVNASIDDSSNSPVLTSVNVVQPQTIENVPASGTKSFYIKTGIESDSVYELWYTGVYLDGSNYRDSIVYCNSVDGTTFFKNYAAITEYTASGIYGDAYCYSHPFVIKDSGNYYMWCDYQYKTDYAEFSDSSIYRSTSSDGRVWNDFDVSVSKGAEGTYDITGSYSPSVVKLSDTSYKVWYTGLDLGGISRILAADSTDGESWTNFQLSKDKDTPSILLDADETEVKNPCVLYIDGIYKMWYEGVDPDGVSRVIYCHSSDGLSWSGFSLAAVPGQVKGYDSFGCGSPFIIYDADLYRMWYSASGPEGSIVVYTYSVGGLVWYGHTVVMSGGEEGIYDYYKSHSTAAVINTVSVEPNVLKSVAIKIYND